MAEVEIIPKIRCDNCGFVADKVPSLVNTGQRKTFGRPREWGAMSAEGGRICQQTYGSGKDRLDFTDLCPGCAEAALIAAAAALKLARGETS